MSGVRSVFDGLPVELSLALGWAVVALVIVSTVVGWFLDMSVSRKMRKWGIK